jgi:imidazoleglycerol phosphate synthase cyclase subunit
VLKKRVIPCLDVRDGRVVKGVRFQDLRDSGDPAERAAAYAAQGADEIVLLDVTATLESRRARAALVRSVRQRLDIPLTVGGGVSTAEDARLCLESGADKVALNSAAVSDPDLLARLAERFGSQAVIAAVDARRTTSAAGPPGWRVVTRAGTHVTDLDAVAWVGECAQRGAGEVLLTAWDRDGTRSGYELELIAAATRAVRVPVIASGGAATPAHMVAALDHGADAVLAASVFHDGELTVAQVKLELARAGVRVRT